MDELLGKDRPDICNVTKVEVGRRCCGNWPVDGGIPHDPCLGSLLFPLFLNVPLTKQSEFIF